MRDSFRAFLLAAAVCGPAACAGQPAAPATTVAPPSADAERKRALDRAELCFRPCVFSGEKFPPVEFEQPALVKDLIGPYTLKATFYDAACNPVTEAKTPGRYGAIVEVRQGDGTATKRFLTLFRQAEPLRWRGLKLPLTVELPKEVGVDPAVAREQAETLAEFLKWQMVKGFERSSDGAVLLAGLHEMTPGTPAADRTGPWRAATARLLVLRGVYGASRTSTTARGLMAPDRRERWRPHQLTLDRRLVGGGHWRLSRSMVSCARSGV